MDLVPVGAAGLFADGTAPACLPLAGPADLPVGDPADLSPGGFVTGPCDLDSGAAGFLGMAMIALHLGQGPFLPACWSPTVKLVLQPGQVTGIGIHAPAGDVEFGHARTKLPVFAIAAAKSSRLVPTEWTTE